MKELRASIGPEERGRLADEIEGRLFALGQLDGTRTIMLFASFGSEVPTQGMIERALKDGRRVILPYLQDGEIHGAEIGGRRGMVRSSHGPMEPALRTEVPPEEIDVVVAPGLAFDREGNRLGYGGGHYDRFLDRLGDAARVVIGFHAQLVGSVPSGPNDRRVDLIVTDHETVICSSPPGP
jgi:5-formyltetrahydrofolate cyclo-ligase